MKIKQICSKFALTLAVLLSVSNAVFADGSAFTPLNFDDATYSTPSAVKSAPSAAVNKTPMGTGDILSTASGEIPIGNDNIQNAILELDNAQVGIRNDLLNYKAKYSDVDAQYKLVKNERNMLHKQVKSIEKRIKNIDRAKDKIRKNML